MDAARHSDALFHTLVSTAVDGIIVIDERGLVEVYNKACERLFGYSAGEVMGQNVKMLMPEPFHGEHDGYLRNYRKSGERRIIGIGREVLGRRKTGTTFPMYLSVGEGLIEGRRMFVGILHDLTEVRSVSTEYAATQRKLAAIVESSEDAIIGKTLDGIVTSWNAGAQRIFGHSEAEIIGCPIAVLFPEDRVAEEKLILAQIRSGSTIKHYETVRRRKDGSKIDISLSVSPIYDDEGRIVGASKIARDITERKQSEKKLRDLQAEMAHVSRLNSMSQLSSALAHEINQPLTATSNYMNAARALLQSFHDPRADKVESILGKSNEQIQRASQIIRRLREFVEKRKVSRVPADINDVVQDAVELGLITSTDANVMLKADLAVDLPQILMDRIQIQQVMVNLIRNAIEAMVLSEKKEIEITTERAAAYVQVSVRDSGPGLSEEVAGRLFQPFVSTKSTGMGIGLMICREIVEAHGGNLAALPAPSGGMIFRFQLPITAAKTDSDD